MGHPCCIIIDVPPQTNSRAIIVLYNGYMSGQGSCGHGWWPCKDKIVPCAYSKSAKSSSSGVSWSCARGAYCLLRSSPCRPDDNNRLESSSKGSSCPAVVCCVVIGPIARGERELTTVRPFPCDIGTRVHPKTVGLAVISLESE